MRQILLLILLCIVPHAGVIKDHSEIKAIKRIEKRDIEIRQVIKDIDKEIIKFNEIYKRSKELFKNHKYHEITMAINYLNTELATLKKYKKTQIEKYQKIISTLKKKDKNIKKYKNIISALKKDKTIKKYQEMILDITKEKNKYLKKINRKEK